MWVPGSRQQTPTAKFETWPCSLETADVGKTVCLQETVQASHELAVVLATTPLTSTVMAERTQAGRKKTKTPKQSPLLSRHLKYCFAGCALHLNFPTLKTGAQSQRVSWHPRGPAKLCWRDIHVHSGATHPPGRSQVSLGHLLPSVPIPMATTSTQALLPPAFSAQAPG